MFAPIRSLLSRRFAGLIRHDGPTASFHASSQCLVKHFIEGENTFAHKILERLGNYNLMPRVDYSVPVAENLEPLPSSTQELTNAELVSCFEKVARWCRVHDLTISDERWNGIVDLFIERVGSLSDEELLEAIKILSIFPSAPGVTALNFVEMWTLLDDECLKRMDQWSVEKRLLVCDHWYRLSLVKVSWFTLQATKRIGRNLKRLSPNNLVQTLFYVNMLRKPLVEMYDFEVALARVIGQLTMDEIAIMAMSFFKTQTRLNIPEVKTAIYGRLKEECFTTPDISLVGILKILRYSAKLTDAQNVISIQRKLLPKIADELSLLGCLHLALLGSGFQCYDPDCLDAVIERFVRDHREARLKDLERIAFLMALFNVQTEAAHTLCRAIIAELPNRKAEIVQYKRCFPPLINFLTICGHHNEQLIEVVLTKQFYEAAFGRNVLLLRDVFCLDSYTQIYLKGQYKGTRVTDQFRRTLANMLCNYMPEEGSKYKLSQSDKALVETKAALDAIYGENKSNEINYTVLEHLVPHFERPDILMAFDKSAKPLPIQSLNLPRNYSGIILTKEELLKNMDDAEGVQTVAIVFGGFNSYTRVMQSHTGVLRMKIDQLKKIGHVVVEVPFFEWQWKSAREREVYLNHKITKSLQNQKSLN